VCTTWLNANVRCGSMHTRQLFGESLTNVNHCKCEVACANRAECRGSGNCICVGVSCGHVLDGLLTADHGRCSPH
jgi:hypothetical protein